MNVECKARRWCWYGPGCAGAGAGIECKVYWAECSVIRNAIGVCSVSRYAGDGGMELAVSGPVWSVECSCIVAECSVIRN